VNPNRVPIEDLTLEIDYLRSDLAKRDAKIEWLLELVESAYRDGWQDGSVRDPFGNVGSLDDWERSDTKSSLAEYKS
jgi:hypothetical protein